MRLPEETDIRRANINILPMIDVIFAILAFFIISTLSLTRAEGLPVNLPRAITAVPQNQIDLTLSIAADGSLALGDEAIAIAALADRVRDLSAGVPVMVTIRADETTDHGSVVAAMDQLRLVPGVRLAIATTQP